MGGNERDLQHMGLQLAQIWNAFLRGQILIMALAAAIYTVMLSVMGVNYAWDWLCLPGWRVLCLMLARSSCG